MQQEPEHASTRSAIDALPGDSRGASSRGRRSDVHLRACVIVLVVIAVASKLGDALAPTLLAEGHQGVLLALNANDLHLALAAGAGLGLGPYLAVGIARRLLEDPLYYHLGRRYGVRAVDWLEEVLPGTLAAFERSKTSFRRFATVAVAVEPGAIVCLLAGTSNMPTAWFAAVNVFGTVARVIVIRWAGHAAAGHVTWALGHVVALRGPLTAATAVVSAAAAMPFMVGLVRLLFRKRIGQPREETERGGRGRSSGCGKDSKTE